MDTVGRLRGDIASLMASAAAGEGVFLKRRERAASRLPGKRRELEEAQAALSAAAEPPFLRGIGVVRRIWRAATSSRLAALAGAVSAAEAGVRQTVAEGRNSETGRKAMASIAGRLDRCRAQITDLDHPPPELSARLESLSGRVADLGNRPSAKNLASVAGELILCVDTWAKAGRMSRADAPDESGQGRIWLPIPVSMSSQARALGARHDPSAQGASQFYVSTGDPLARFNSLLPHAFRETRPALRFSSVRANAQRQNLWSFMDPLSWDHIRNVNYSMTGRRCILCGKQSGNLVRRLEPDKPNKVGTVECHEVWNWTRPDPDIPVGVQTLERIMVVCFDCHMCFHDDVARAKALRVGDEAFGKQVQGYLIQRRSFLTGTGPKDVVLEMRAERDRLAAHRDVATWVVDLSKLAKQDYMYGQTPTLVSDNPAGVKASQIGGITFRDESGRVYPAVPPERLYQETAMKWITQPEPTYRVVGRR